SSKKKRVQKESVSKQGRKNAKGDGKAQENAQSEGRTKETDEVRLSTEDEVSTAKEGVSTDFEKVSTDRPKLSTDDLKVSTDEQMESNDDQGNASEEIFEGTEDQREGIEEKVESTAEQKESCKDPFTIREPQNKARLVAQGYNQQEGIDYDETYALVARLESIRILLTYACALDFKLFQMYVKSAFLNGFINEEVYVAQPLGFIDFEKPDHVYKLKKALYGLKQAPKACSTFQDMCDEFAKIMHDEFEMSMMGELNFFLGLQIKQMEDETVVYADSDHAGDYVDRKSTSGICTFMGCCLTSWFLKKQTALAISTTEAEYVSAEKACQQALWMKQALIDYDVRLDDVPIMCDNKGAIDLSKNPVQHSRTKHIEIRHHFLRDNVQKGHISIEKVPSVDNIADILTKPLKRESFNYLRLGLGMMEHIP
ncbi:copia protein, partial [Tanacetum coccineum]